MEKPLTDWSALLGGLAHELKNPLSTINLNLQLLREQQASGQTPQSERAIKKVDLLLGEVERLQTMLTDFQRLVSNAPLDLREKDLNDIVADVLEFENDDLTRRGISVASQFDRNLPPIPLDENLVRQALLNLLVNARDAMEDAPGTLTVSTRRERDYALVEVIDTGSGMDEETLKRAFSVYFSTKQRGTGLGLPMVRRIVERHGGIVTCESSPGVGTRIGMGFPLEPKGAPDEGS